MGAYTVHELALHRKGHWPDETCKHSLRAMWTGIVSNPRRACHDTRGTVDAGESQWARKRLRSDDPMVRNWITAYRLDGDQLIGYPSGASTRLMIAPRIDGRTGPICWMGVLCDLGSRLEAIRADGDR